MRKEGRLTLSAAKKILAVLLCTVVMPSLLGAEYLGTRLFDYTVQNNRLPYGEYMVLRSYRNVTQLLISKDINKLYLYTDRDNLNYGRLFSTGFSRIDSIIINPPEMEQVEFDRTVRRLIFKGDQRDESTIKYPGLEAVLQMVESGKASVTYDNDDCLVKIAEAKNGEQYIMKFNRQWNKLTLCCGTSSDSELSSFYQIYIDESYDANIEPLLRRFASAAKKNMR